MSININFTPNRLKALVIDLERRIRVPTGEPIRLDIELYLNALKKYAETGLEKDVPNISSLEMLCLHIPLIQNEKLLNAFFACLSYSSSKKITSIIVEFYFNNYEDENARNYLFNNIHHDILMLPGWKVWSINREVFFKGNVVKNIADFIIKNKVSLKSIPENIGMEKPYRIREDALSFLCDDIKYFKRYLQYLDLESILSILKDEQIKRLHTAIWNNTLPFYCEEAKEMKIKNDTDHRLFSLAKLRLNPNKSPQWLRLNNEAKMAYQEWAIGARLEAFFDEDTDNERILFWKRHVRHISKIKEIEYHNEIAAFAIEIGKYEFIEFRDIGAIYVYSKGSVWIPTKVNSLDKELKFREKVINPGIGTQHGEGWVPHWGKIWAERVNRLINKALEN